MSQTTKLAALEATVQAQSSKIQKLRADKSQLQSLLELEQSSITKLEFENKTLQTLLDSLKAQVTKFQAQLSTGTNTLFMSFSPVVTSTDSVLSL